jgi:hypothetical protein
MSRGRSGVSVGCSVCRNARARAVAGSGARRRPPVVAAGTVGEGVDQRCRAPGACMDQWPGGLDPLGASCEATDGEDNQLTQELKFCCADS